MNLDRIIDYALRLDDTTIKRPGWVLEHSGVPAAELAPLRDHSITGYRVLDASGPQAGPYSSTWRIQENLPGRV